MASPERAVVVLGQLVAHGVATAIEGGPSTVYTIAGGREMAAAYYRNTIVHHFVDTAMAELGLAAADGAADPEAAFWEEVTRVRDLFKFDFFFHERTEFRRRIATELERYEQRWQHRLAEGRAASVLSERPLTVAPWVLRPFLESYRVVADTLVGHEGELDDKKVLAAAVALGRQYVAQGRLRSPESLASTLLDNALRLARNRGLLDEHTEDKRKAFAATIDATMETIDRLGS
jgi:glycerol-3-phosphate O-acyltransferase